MFLSNFEVLRVPEDTLRDLMAVRVYVSVGVRDLKFALPFCIHLYHKLP